MLGAVAQLVAQRECDTHFAARLRIDLQIARQPDMPVRPAFVVANEIAPHLLPRRVSLPKVIHPISEKLQLRLRIPARKDKCPHEIPEPLRARIDIRSRWFRRSRHLLGRMRARRQLFLLRKSHRCRIGRRHAARRCRFGNRRGSRLRRALRRTLGRRRDLNRVRSLEKLQLAIGQAPPRAGL